MVRTKEVAIFFSVNNLWCDPEHITLKDGVCSTDIDSLAIGFRPYYLPQEFINIAAITVYIHPIR